MSEPMRYKIAIAGFLDGEMHLKAITGEHLVLTLGPAQIIAAHRELSRQIGTYEPDEKGKKVK